MGRKVKKLEVLLEMHVALEDGYKQGETPSFSRRCQMVLLKLQDYRSKEIASIADGREMSVNNWINRFETSGMEGLQTKEGRGRKPVLTADHLPMVRAAVQAERQRLSQARIIIETNSGKAMSRSTLSRFLKLITAATNESESG